MYPDLMIIVVVVFLGIIAFIFGLLHAIWRGICLFVGWIGGNRTSTDRMTGGRRVCPRLDCRKVEYRDAVYCSQCGTKLSGQGEK